MIPGQSLGERQRRKRKKGDEEESKVLFHNVSVVASFCLNTIRNNLLQHIPGVTTGNVIRKKMFLRYNYFINSHFNSFELTLPF